MGGGGCLGEKYCEGSKCNIEHSSSEVSWLHMWWGFSFFLVFSPYINLANNLVAPVRFY